MKFNTPWAYARFDSPLGPMLLAASARGLTGAWFEGQRYQPDTSAWPLTPAHPVLQAAAAQLRNYFAGQRQPFTLPLDLCGGSAFQQTVWQALLALDLGTTQSYGGLSAALGRPTAVRAVAAAIGRNPISIIVPCHRVLGHSGALTGYAGGLARKTALLQIEGVLPAGRSDAAIRQYP